MSRQAKFLLVSLPTSITPSHDKEEALNVLRRTIGSDGTTYPFNIPTFKIGTLDALVQQADDLAKLEQSCEAVVAKVADSLRTILDGDEEKIAQQKNVNDSGLKLPTLLLNGVLIAARTRRTVSSKLSLEQGQVSE
jgi:V-type H+-transporting ATPase subunit C